ncbi:Crp/Fnr family transcriptional regulator [Rhodoferax sediminis]|uniref:Cyclic nucleotide-binding domain-containing protein n=1 Tax=Rhodoferax sediminis TaxID=2509614 RepID=A0A515DAB7_9BURK|nr:cyclic nucleotide-binding domain-containing protein [Rhodoferax sediminis]QDL37352.1 cyclic nucleotide-binding domain-containing protein [Rhodoferax sediminis]
MAPVELLSSTIASTREALSKPGEVIALLSLTVGVVLVLVSSFVKTMIPLRWLAVASCVGFVIYGALRPSIAVLLLNAALLPINLYRVAEMIRLTRRVAEVSPEDNLSGVWLKPYMHSAKVKAGTVLFRKGDSAKRLYMLAEGQVEFVEVGSVLGPGTIFGEVGLFSPGHRRALTARCIGACTVLSIDESTVKQLYYQNPAFGFKLIALVARRLSADVERLRHESGERGP